MFGIYRIKLDFLIHGDLPAPLSVSHGLNAIDLHDVWNGVLISMSSQPARYNLKNEPPLSQPTEIFTFRMQKMDYFDAEGISLRTGYTNKLDWYLLPIRELLDNACDFLQKYYKGSKDATITVNIHLTDKLFHLTICNSNKDDKQVFTNLKPIFDFDRRVGSKQDVHVISRGMLGDALKQILSLGYVLLHNDDDGSNFSDKQWDYPLIITHNKQKLSVILKVDKAGQEAKAEIKQEPKVIHTDTELELWLPVIDDIRNDLTKDYIQKYCRRYTLLSTDISFNFKIIDDISHSDSNNGQNMEEELANALSGAEREALNIEINALHPISEWKNVDSIYSYKPEEFKRRLLNVVDRKVSIYDILSKFREASNIPRGKYKQYEITVQQLLDLPDDERNKIIEQYFEELHKMMLAPELSLPYPTRFKGKHDYYSQTRKDILYQRIRNIRDDITTNNKIISYKLEKGTVTNENLQYPFAFEIIAVPLEEPLGDSRRSDDVKRHEFIGMVNYSFSPKNNYFAGKYKNNTIGYFAKDIHEVLSYHKFHNYGSNYNKVPCLIVGNLITPKWDPTSHDKSGVNIEPFVEKIISAVQKISKEIPTYYAAGIHWQNVGSKSEHVRTDGIRGNVSAKQLLEKFLRDSGRL